MAGPVIRARNRPCDALRVACNFLFSACNILSFEYTRISGGFIYYVLTDIINCPDNSTRWQL